MGFSSWGSTLSQQRTLLKSLEARVTGSVRFCLARSAWGSNLQKNRASRGHKAGALCNVDPAAESIDGSRRDQSTRRASTWLKISWVCGSEAKLMPGRRAEAVPAATPQRRASAGLALRNMAQA